MPESLATRTVQKNSKSVKTKSEPKAGMGVTVYSYSHRSVGTILGLSKSKKSFLFQFDRAVLVHSDGVNQEYQYERNEQGPIYMAFKTKKGLWKIQKDGRIVGIGYRNYYIDYSL